MPYKIIETLNLNIMINTKQNLNAITSYLIGVCENNSVSFTHKQIANCFNIFTVNYGEISFGVIQHVNFINQMNNYHLDISYNTEYRLINGKIEKTKKIIFAYFE